MPQIIVFGDIHETPLHMRINGSREMVISGKWPRSIYVEEGPCTIFATTISKSQRTLGALSGTDTFMGRAANAMVADGNTTLSGTVLLDSDDVWLFQVKSKVTKNLVYNQVMDRSEAGRYVRMDMVLEYGERAPNEKNKWVVLLLCLFLGIFGVHRFYEGKIFTGIIYLLTLGLAGIGVLVDLVKIFQRVDNGPSRNSAAAAAARGSSEGTLIVVLGLLIVLILVAMLAVLLFVPA